MAGLAYLSNLFEFILMLFGVKYMTTALSCIKSLIQTTLKLQFYLLNVDYNVGFSAFREKRFRCIHVFLYFSTVQS